MNQRRSKKTVSKDKQLPLLYLVDDEQLVLDVAEATLAPRFRVKKFHDPETALKDFKSAKSKPEVLVTDYAMGKMNGLELIEKCKAAHPSLKTLLISGMAGAEIMRTAPVPADKFLAKPYPSPTLVETVRDLLAA
ncbi:MAG TPA: response regulator [Verrucomicrobiae bacterium]|nr:response regulator [Verrucomicrobiae bacterium]